MTEIKYSEAQISELKHNKYVKNCTSKHIVFTKQCKLEAVKLWRDYILSKDVFKILGFPDYVLESDTPKNCLFRWKGNIKTNGIIEEKKGRPKKEVIDISKMTKDEELEYLRHKVALLEELETLTKGGYP